MVDKNKPLSSVIPVLIASLVCDVSVSDPSTGKVSLIGIFDRIHVGSFPTKRSLSFYIKLTDAEGHYEINIKYIRADSNELLAELKSTFDPKDRLASYDLHVSFPPLLIPQEGRYEFQVWANSVFLGGTSIMAIKRKEPQR